MITLNTCVIAIRQDPKATDPKWNANVQQKAAQSEFDSFYF